MTRILIVEDDSRTRAALVFQLREAGYSPVPCANAEEAVAELDQQTADLLLLDVRLPGASGVDLVRRLAEEQRLPATVMLSGEASVAEAIETFRLGVHDFLEKPVGRERLVRSVTNALEFRSLRREVAELRSRLVEDSSLLGSSPAMNELRRLIERVAPTDARVLIRGESGSGKELVAEALHRGSRRAAGPLVRLNCAALPAQLVEAELFGHTRGAFTGAHRDRAGLIEAADGGTLFLDEIGDMELQLQARLLRVLEDGRVRRVGDSRDRAVDVRVVAATHTDLERAITEGSFRQDLYFRLAHVPLLVPPLRERPGDVPLLLEHFLARAANRHALPRRSTSPEIVAMLDSLPWPGNVRELANLAERLAILAAGEVLSVADLPVEYREPQMSPLLDGASPAAPVRSLREARAEFERDYLERALRAHDGNVAATARTLGLERTSLHEKLRTLGVRRG